MLADRQLVFVVQSHFKPHPTGLALPERLQTTASTGRVATDRFFLNISALRPQRRDAPTSAGYPAYRADYDKPTEAENTRAMPLTVRSCALTSYAAAKATARAL